MRADLRSVYIYVYDAMHILLRLTSCPSMVRVHVRGGDPWVDWDGGGREDGWTDLGGGEEEVG